MKLDRELIKSIFVRNSFPYEAGDPLVAVFRNTDADGNQVKDTGTNCCDTVMLLVDNYTLIARGRSIPHIKYQKAMMAGDGKCNRIASSFTVKAFRRGNHISHGKEYPALIQYVRFLLWRSKDLIIGNDDDYPEQGDVSDNCHGWAPSSAGCVTIEGNMGNPYQTSTGSWLQFVTAIYQSSHTFYNAVVLEHEDLTASGIRLRPGSTGPAVASLQRVLNLRPDGDFGPLTFDAVRAWQKQNGMHDDGIYRGGLA